MRRRQFIPTAVAGLFAIYCVATSAQPVSATALNRQKLVIQVSDAEPAQWNLALNNAKNVQEELGASQVDIYDSHGGGKGFKDGIGWGLLREADGAPLPGLSGYRDAAGGAA